MKKIYIEPAISAIMLPELMQTTLPIGSSHPGGGEDPSGAEGKENSDIVDDEEEDSNPKANILFIHKKLWEE